MCGQFALILSVGLGIFARPLAVVNKAQCTSCACCGTVPIRAMNRQRVVHKQVTVRRLLRFTGLPKATLEEDLGALVRMGLVHRDQRDVLHIDRFVAHLVTERLRTQGMLA